MISYSKILTLPKNYFLPRINAEYGEYDWVDLANY